MSAERQCRLFNSLQVAAKIVLLQWE